MASALSSNDKFSILINLSFSCNTTITSSNFEVTSLLTNFELKIYRTKAKMTATTKFSNLSTEITNN